MTWVEAHRHAMHRGPGAAEQLECLGVVANLDAHLGEQLIGLAFDQIEPLVAEQLERGNVPPDERRGRWSCPGTGAARHSRRSTAVATGVPAHRL